MCSVSVLAENLREIQERIAAAAERSGRSPNAVRLVAVTKTHSVERIAEALAAGVTEIGESYVQEAEAKLSQLREAAAVRHFIGHLQRNKAGKVVQWFDCVQSVDSLELAQALSRRSENLNRSLDVLLEVNIAGDPARFGVWPEHVLELAAGVAELPALRLQGLMGIAPNPAAAPDGINAARKSFQLLARLFEQLPDEHRQVLSMGMTGDFELAIEEGSTMVRVGTGIFGPRRSS